MLDIIRRGSQIPSLNNVGLAKVVMIEGWYIWWERRQYIHGEGMQNPGRAAMSTAVLTRNYEMSREKVAKVEETWRRPLEGKLMLNIDTIFYADAGMSSVGVVIRDSEGGCIAASHSYLAHVLDAPMAEARALKESP